MSYLRPIIKAYNTNVGIYNGLKDAAGVIREAGKKEQ
jgi:hypothetical protein